MGSEKIIILHSHLLFNQYCGSSQKCDFPQNQVKQSKTGGDQISAASMGTRKSDRYSFTECEAAAADVLCLNLGERSPAGNTELGEDILGNWISICGEVWLCALCINYQEDLTHTSARRSSLLKRPTTVSVYT